MIHSIVLVLCFAFLGASCTHAQGNIYQTPTGYNCEEMDSNLQVRWNANGRSSIDIELIGEVGVREYIAFGPSGSSTFTAMLGSDPAIADVVGNGTVRVRDYHIASRSTCTGEAGVCTDQVLGTGNDITRVSGVRDEANGVTLARYTRPLAASDDLDLPMTRRRLFISWAVGPVGSSGIPQFHSRRSTDFSIVVDRPARDNCRNLGPTTTIDCRSLVARVVRQVTNGKTCPVESIRRRLNRACRNGICEASATVFQCSSGLRVLGRRLAGRVCS